MKAIFKKTFRIIRSVVCWVCITLLVVAIVTVVLAKINGTNPSILGYSIYRVSSGSMSPELEVGDVILGKAVDDPMNIKVGDVVTYEGRGELSGMLITHKVIVAPYEEEGVLKLQTQGVANEIPDNPINVDRVVSVVVKEVAFLTVFYNFFFSPWGLLAIVALIILVFIDEVIAIIRSTIGLELPKKKEKVDINDIIDRIKTDSVEESCLSAEEENSTTDESNDDKSSDND